MYSRVQKCSDEKCASAGHSRVLKLDLSGDCVACGRGAPARSALEFAKAQQNIELVPLLFTYFNPFDLTTGPKMPIR